MLGLHKSLKLLYNYVKDVFLQDKTFCKLLDFDGENIHDFAVFFAHQLILYSNSMFNISTAVATKSMLVHICSPHRDVSILQVTYHFNDPVPSYLLQS